MAPRRVGGFADPWRLCVRSSGAQQGLSLKHLLSRPAAITFVVAAGVGVASAVGLNAQADTNSALEFRTPVSSSSTAGMHRNRPPTAEVVAAPRPLRLT